MNLDWDSSVGADLSSLEVTPISSENGSKGSPSPQNNNEKISEIGGKKFSFGGKLSMSLDSIRDKDSPRTSIQKAEKMFDSIEKNFAEMNMPAINLEPMPSRVYRSLTVDSIDSNAETLREMRGRSRTLDSIQEETM